MTPVGCAVGPPITGQLNLEGIPVLGLVDTGASVTCMGFSVWWQYRAQRGPLKPFEGVVHGAHGKPLQIVGKAQHLNLQWGEARGRATFIVIIGLKSSPVLIRMDIMRPLRVHIDVTCGTATPAQPDPQTIHLNAAQTQNSPASRALLFQAVDIPAETERLVCCHNPWRIEDVYFCPEEGLHTFVSGVPALTSGSEVWVAVHNHRPEPLCLHTGQAVGTFEIVALADSPLPPPATSQNCQLPVPEHLSPAQQQQLKALFHEFSDIINQEEDDLGCTPLLQHTIDTEGPPLRQPYRRQNPAVRREEMAQVQQMLSSCVIRPCNSPWASPIVMVKKKDGSLRFCVDFRQLNTATIKDAHPIPCIDDLLDELHILAGAHPGAGQGEDGLPHQQWPIIRIQPGPVWPLQCSCYVLQTHGSCPGWPPLGNLPLLLGRHHRLRRHMGGAPRPPSKSLRASPPRTAQARCGKMHLCGQGSQLPRSPGHLRRPLT